MSATKKNTFAVLPTTVRGQSVHLGKDPKGKNVLYTNGRSVIIRDLANPLIADQYIEHVQNATVARYAPSGFYIASGDMAGNVRVWDTVQAEHPLKLEIKVISGEIKDIAWDSESKRLIAVGNGQEKYGAVFFADSGSSCGEISGHSKVVNSCDFKPSRPYRAVTASDDLCVNYYEGPPFKYKASNKDHTRFINCVRFNASGDLYVTVGADGQALLFDGKTGEKTGSLGGGNAHSGSIYSCCWSDDGKSLMTCSADRTVKLWDVATQTSTTTFELGPNVEDQQVGCLWQGQYLVSLSLAGDFNYLDAASPSKPTKVIRGHSKPVMSLAVSKDSKTFFTGDVSGRIVSWDFATGVGEPLEGGHTNQASALVATEHNLVSIAMDDTVRFTPIPGKAVASNFFKSETQPKALSAKGDVAVVASIDALTVVKGNTKLSSIPIKTPVYSVAINADSTEVAAGTDNDVIIIYSFDSTHLTEKKRIQGNRGQILALAYSPDGTKLAAGDSNRQVIIYDVPSYEVKLSEWVFHSAKINCVTWSPSSLYVASASIDTHVFVWNLNKPTKRIQIKGAHYSSVNAVSFVDDNTLISVGQDGCAKSWGITHH